MRYGIFSDIHSNLEALNAVLQAYQKEAIDLYLCVGDIVGYAANPHECIECIHALSIPAVAGNHDYAAADAYSVEDFNPLATQALLWTRELLTPGAKEYLSSLPLLFKDQNLTMVHGTVDRPESFHYMRDVFSAQQSFSVLTTAVCFIGHTHVPGVFIQQPDGSIEYSPQESIHLERGKKRYLVNVGSVGQPRDGNPKAAYAVYDTQSQKIEIKRVSYDVRVSRNKIMRSGLPQFLGERLLSGR
ncbi:MAG: metallophosphatase family protein [Candidatus Omnitrophica bacterium]|nr:metallophosphatase family protein [Candidatus Omnitrophota bacterium]